MRSMFFLLVAAIMAMSKPVLACGGEALGPNQHNDFFIAALQRDAQSVGIRNQLTLVVHPCPFYGRDLTLWPPLIWPNTPIQVIVTPRLLSLDTHSLERYGRQLLCALRINRIPPSHGLWRSGATRDEILQRCNREFDGHDRHDPQRTIWLEQVFPFERLFQSALSASD